jgi:DNA-binding transcriptional LysR family regulator
MKYFCDAVRLGGVSKAARANYVTQSAISQGISKLEKALGVHLVAKHPGRFRLTPEGDMAFIRASKILQEAHEFSVSFLDEKQNLGPLEFASTYSFALAVIPDELKRFRECYPDTKVSFSLGKNHEIKQLVRAGVIDFGLLPDEGDLTGFDLREVYSGYHGLYVAKNISPKKVKQLSFILASSACHESQFFISQYAAKYGKKPEVLLEVNSWEVIAKMTTLGLGIGYLPDYIAKTKKEQLRPYDIGLDVLECCISALYPKGMMLRKSSELFLDMLAQS